MMILMKEILIDNHVVCIQLIVLVLEEHDKVKVHIQYMIAAMPCLSDRCTGNHKINCYRHTYTYTRALMP